MTRFCARDQSQFSTKEPFLCTQWGSPFQPLVVAPDLDMSRELSPFYELFDTHYPHSFVAKFSHLRFAVSDTINWMAADHLGCHNPINCLIGRLERYLRKVSLVNICVLWLFYFKT